MRVKITGVEENKSIQAIKALRAVETIGLKEAKDAIDRVKMGTPYELETSADGIRHLREFACSVEQIKGLSQDDLISALKDFPANLRVGDLRRTLEVIRERAG